MREKQQAEIWNKQQKKLKRSTENVDYIKQMQRIKFEKEYEKRMQCVRKRENYKNQVDEAAFLQYKKMLET